MVKVIKIIIWVCRGFTLVCLLAFISLPTIMETQIEKRLPQFLNPNDVEFDIQKIGLFNTVVSKIHVGKGISIDSINIDYDIKNLPAIHLNKVTLSGLSVHASLDENNQIRIQGLEFLRTSKDQTGQPDLSDLSFLPEKVVLQNGKIILHTLDDEFLIPFDVLSTISLKDGKIAARILVYPFGEKISTFVTYDVKKGIEFLKIEGKSFDLGHIAPFVSKITQKVQLKGPVDFILKTSSPQKKWNLTISQVGFVQPVGAAIKDLSTTLLIDPQKISARGTFGIFHSLQPVTFNAHFNRKGLNSKWALTANDVSIKSDLMTTSFPLLGVSGWFCIDKNNKPSLGMTLKASDGKIISSKLKTRADGINIEIPISYPNIESKIWGKYSVPNISYNNQYNFSTSGKILQTGSKEFQVIGGANFKTLPGLKARFKSIVGFEKGLRTSLQVKINDGEILMPDINFTASGINTTVDFNDLLVLESVPGQMLTIDSIEMNKIKINEAKIRFSIADASSLLVENIRFKWCNGLVSTESIRFPQNNNTYSLNLYCDRLELAQLLKQTGAFQAEGTGTLNGRIPVLYSDGNISFDNGFLFSTPGSGGKIIIKNSDMITSGIPMDNPQFAQLDLAQEALKDFEYKWAKLVFHTFEDTLYVNMELDGKPSKILPFEYRKELGGFIRVNTSSPGSHFQGIKLDVNLKLPFNEVMKFGNKIKSILN